VVQSLAHKMSWELDRQLQLDRDLEQSPAANATSGNRRAGASRPAPKSSTGQVPRWLICSGVLSKSPYASNKTVMSAVPSQDRRFFMGPFRWLAEPSAAELEAERFTVLDWRDLNKRWVDPARRVGMERKSLDSAAKPWFDWLAEVDRLAVLGIELRDLQTVKDVLGFLVEPAARLGIELVLAGEPGPDELDASAFVDEDFGYPYTFERLLWRMRGARPTVRAPASLDELDFTPDDTQAEAVAAGEGVVQIIAPAGSGKTAVLVERVRELRSRGAPADAITCVTFNKAAANELRERLSAAEVGDVRASTFHSLGLQVLRRAGRLAGKEIAGHLPTQGQWRWLAGNAMKAAGENGR
jgi:UvrD/REP helicase N-terminal domain